MFESKINRGRANGYAPLNGDGKVGLNYLPDVVGVAGTSGTSGVNGVNGSQGSSGANGTNGLNGTNGTSGTSPFAEVDTGSFATTGSNTFTGVQTLAGTSGTSWAELTIGQTDIFGNYNSYDIRATGSSAAGISLTSDVVSVVGVVDKEFGPAGNNSVVFSGKYGFPYSDGPFTGIGILQSGSQEKVWIYDYTGKASFPGDVNIGYTGFVAGEYSGSLNVNKGNINVSGSINTTGSLNISTGSVNIKNGNINVTKGNINVSGSVNISSSLVVSSTFVNNGSIGALNSDLIIDGGDIILSGSMYFGSGSSITETSSSIIITPAGAAAGQSLVIRPTAGQFIVSSSHPSGFIPGESTGIYVGTQFGNGNGTLDYEFTGTTAQQLGRATTGTLTFSSQSEKNITWTIPAESVMTTFTFSLISGSGFSEQGGISVGSLPNITVTLDGSSVSENNHIHLVSGDPSMVDIYLGDDDNYVKVEKNAGDIVVGTNSDTNRWRFDTNGNLTLSETGVIISNQNLKIEVGGIPVSIGDTASNSGGWDVNQGTNISTTGGFGNGLTVDIVGDEAGYISSITINTPGIGYRDGDIITATNGSSYVSFSIFVKAWVFNTNSSLTVPGNINGAPNLAITGSNTFIGTQILSGSFAQEVNYAPFASASSYQATTLDITKDIHLLDVTAIESDNHWILPDGLYDGQVVRFALKGDGTANPNGIYIWPNYLRSGLGLLRNGQSWSPFYDNSAGSARSLATAVYIDGAWNIDNGFYNLD